MTSEYHFNPGPERLMSWSEVARDERDREIDRAVAEYHEASNEADARAVFVAMFTVEYPLEVQA